jgi:NAD(P)-dependent dehydrogenase (short-subunit alcohol dehydrogenase family)
MDVYIVTGATKGIGLEAARYLRSLGNKVVNIDVDHGDITADLGTPEGREKAIAAVCERYEGIDGLILNAGIAHHAQASRVAAVNYFGTVALAEGLFPLLRKKGGRCAITVSGGIAYLDFKRTKYFFDALLVNCGDEERICKLIDSFPPEGKRENIYISTKIALVRYIRRVAPTWAAAGVCLNGLAPGAVDTTIMDDVPHHAEDMDKGRFRFQSIQTPSVYGIRKMLDAADVGPTLGMLALPQNKGLCGAVLYCDGGAASVLHPEKWY